MPGLKRVDSLGEAGMEGKSAMSIGKTMIRTAAASAICLLAESLFPVRISQNSHIILSVLLSLPMPSCGPEARSRLIGLPNEEEPTMKC